MILISYFFNFKTYVASIDKEFAASTIQAIGRCASNIPEVADTCLAGLIRMLSNRDETVVSECIIVIKKLLQMGQKGHNDVITHMAKLLEKIKVPMARASILWLIGEYSERIPKVAPDVLRKMAKSFSSEVFKIMFSLSITFFHQICYHISGDEFSFVKFFIINYVFSLLFLCRMILLSCR